MIKLEFQFNSCDKYYLVEVSHTDSIDDKIAWCKAQESDGKFYHWNESFAPYTTCPWWFEYEVDALLFRLSWA